MTTILRPPAVGDPAAETVAQPDAAPATVEASRLYREGMSRLAAAVNVITTDGPAGLAGFTATAVTSVSDSPPTLLACMHRTAQSRERLLANGTFCINVLAACHDDLADVFAGRTGLHLDARFQAGAWRKGATGVPLLDGALASFECRLSEVKDVATHHVLFGDVVAVRVGAEARGLAWFRRGYHAI
jgi:flavin reductase